GVTGSVGFARAKLVRANLQGISLGGTINCKFTSASLQNAKLTGYFSGADFTDADFRGANLRGATFAGVTWKGAVYDDDTAFPEGFEPGAAGMVFIRPDAKPKPANDSPVRKGKDYHDQDLSKRNFASAPLNDSV